MAAAGFLSSYLSGSLPCLTPYNRKYNVLSASLNKTFPSFLVEPKSGNNVLLKFE